MPKVDELTAEDPADTVTELMDVVVAHAAKAEEVRGLVRTLDALEEAYESSVAITDVEYHVGFINPQRQYEFHLAAAKVMQILGRQADKAQRLLEEATAATDKLWQRGLYLRAKVKKEKKKVKGKRKPRRVIPTEGRDRQGLRRKRELKRTARRFSR